MNTTGYHKPPRGTLLNRTHPLALGLTGAWILNEGTGDRVRDACGFAGPGVLNNMDPPADWIAGARGFALDFDGSDDFLAIPGGPPLDFGADGDRVSLAMVVRTTTSSSYLLSKGVPTYSSPKLVLRREPTDAVSVRIRYGWSWHIWQSSDPVFVPDHWRLIVVTYRYGDGSSLGVYAEGLPVPGTWTSGDGNGAPGADSQDLHLARYSTTYSPGQLGSLLLWNRLLAPAEVLQCRRAPYDLFAPRLLPWACGATASIAPPGPTRFRDRTGRLRFSDSTSHTAFRDRSQRSRFTGNVS
jgi:hypothetical protein